MSSQRGMEPHRELQDKVLEICLSKKCSLVCFESKLILWGKDVPSKDLYLYTYL